MLSTCQFRQVLNIAESLKANLMLGEIFEKFVTNFQGCKRWSRFDSVFFFIRSSVNASSFSQRFHNYPKQCERVKRIKMKTDKNEYGAM